MTAAHDAPDLLHAARAFQPELRERAEAIESERKLPLDLHERFAASGFYRMFVPRVYGGLETPPHEAMETIELLARADAASAWCVFIAATSGSALANIPSDAARAIFSSPETLMCGVFAPMGEARMVDGGFRVEGQWQWGSGTQNADWIMGGSRVTRDGEPLLGANGKPRTHLMIAPASEVELLDTWYVSGLSGTGSTDFAFRDVFVPEAHAVGWDPAARIDRPLYAFPQFGLLGISIAAVALGLARAAIDELVAMAGAKTPTGGSRTLANRPSTQSDVARAEATLRAARAFYYEAIDEAWADALAGGPIAIPKRRDVRLATSHTARACADAVDAMYHVAGGTSVYRRSPLQRIFRDVHVVTQHMMVGPATLELTGRLLLGLETDTSTL